MLLDQTTIPTWTARVLRRLGAEIELSSFDRHDRPRSTTPIDARLIITADAEDLRTARRAHLLSCCAGDSSCGSLVLSMKPIGPVGGGDPIWTEHAVGFLSHPTEEELLAQLSVLAGMKGPLAQMRRELGDLRRRQALDRVRLNQLEDECRLAGVVQRELMRGALPAVRGGRWHSWFRPIHHVSGDAFEVVRLDADHLALTLLDATGHGAPAALLAAHAWTAIRGAPLRAAYPDEMSALVLEQLNGFLMAARLSEGQFLSAIHAVFNERTQELTWARGGACYPILLRPDHPPLQVRSAGLLIGVEEHAEFETVRLSLQPGDTVWFHTDGLDALLRQTGELEASGDLAESSWFAALGGQDAQEMMDSLRQRAETHAGMSADRLDDITLVGLHLHPVAAPGEMGRVSPRESLVGTYL